MGWSKRRSRGGSTGGGSRHWYWWWWTSFWRVVLCYGLSPLSALSITCGFVFVFGNLYVLHSGFAQAYRDMDAAAEGAYSDGHDARIYHGAQPEVGGGIVGTSGAVSLVDAGVLEGLPLLALEAIGYIPGGHKGKLHVGLSGAQKSGPQVVLHGFGEARLRKLMGNRRDWGSDLQQSLQYKQQLHYDSLNKNTDTQSSHRAGKFFAGGRGRTSISLLDINTNNQNNVNVFNSQPGVERSHSKDFDKDTALYFHNQRQDLRPTLRQNDINKLSPHDKGKSSLLRAQSLKVFYQQTSQPPILTNISASELRRLLAGGSRCGWVRSLTGREYVGSGWTKAVYRADDPADSGASVAVKMVDLAGHDMAACGERPGMGPVTCYHLASQKLLKEMLLLQALSNSHIIKMLGFCVPRKPYNGDADSLVAMVTELGETIDIIKLLQMSWEDRLRVSYGITSLLKYLANSPYGSVSLNDFRRQQFVLVRGDVTLTDLDDVGFEEPKCDVTSDCAHYFSSANFTLRTPCLQGRCVGYNEKKNVFNAARHFTTFLLPHGAPPSLRPAIDAIVHAYSNATLRAAELLDRLDRVVERYRKGDYVQRPPAQKAINRYMLRENADMPGLFDYRCRYSIASGCMLSALDQQEAEQLCDLDPECKAFVISDKKTWTGRLVVHLKNNITSPSSSPGMSLFIKPGL